MMSTYTPSRLQARKPKGARIDFETIRSVAQRNALAICRRVLPGGKVIGAEYTVRNPKRAEPLRMANRHGARPSPEQSWA